MGAPIRGFTRIAEEPILLHCNIAEPQIVVVLDPTLIGTVDVTEGLPADGVVIINTVEPPEKMRARLRLEKGKVCTVDATGISLAELRENRPNTPMMGALCKVAGVLKLQTVKDDVVKKLGGKLSQEKLDGNLRAIQRAYEEVKVA